MRTCEDMDEVMFSYAEIKAMCAGDPRIKEKMDLDLEVARLRLIKSEHMNTHFRLQDDLIQHFPEAIQAARERIAGYEKDIRHLKTFEAQAPSVEAAQSADTPASSAAATTKKPDAPLFHPMTILGKTYSDKEKAGAALLAALGEAKGKEQAPIGSYKGFNMLLEFNGFDNKHILTLKGSMSYRTDLGSNAGGNLTRINNALAEAPERLKATKAQLDNLHQQVDSAREELKRPFENEAELVEKEARLAVLNVELNIDGRVGQVIDGDVSERGAEHDDDAMSAKSVRPSIMEGLRTGLYGGMQIRPNAPDRTKLVELSI